MNRVHSLATHSHSGSNSSDLQAPLTYSDVIDPTGLVGGADTSMFFGRIVPDTHYPGQWQNSCFNNVISSNGQTLTAYWLGSHPAPIGNVLPDNTTHPNAGLSLGTYLGCAAVPAAGLYAFFTGGFSITNAVMATVIASAAGHDDVQQCATAFGAYLSNVYNNTGSPDWLSGGTDDMSSLVQAIMQAGPTTGLGADLHYEMQWAGPDGGYGANGPGGGSNGGNYYSSDGSDQYGYGGTGSLLKATFDELEDVKHTSALPAPFTFTLAANIGS